MNDTKREPGAYVTFSRILASDFDFEPHDDAEAAGIERGTLVIYGVQAQAVVSVVYAGGTSCSYTLRSAGLWGVVVESSADPYLDEVYAEELATLKADIATLSSAKEV